MPNVNAPHGLQPVQTLSGSPWNGKANLYYIPSTDGSAWAIGDAVTTVSTAGADANGVPQITRIANGAVTAQQLRGVVVGFQVAPVGINQGGMVPGNSVNLNLMTVPATKTYAYYALVADDPNLLFLIQGDNTTTLAATVINANEGFTQAAPASSATPVSGTVLTTGSVGTANTLPLKIISMLYAPNADFTAYTQFLVMINTHELGHGPGTTAA